jgi:hypothetical protein
MRHYQMLWISHSLVLQQLSYRRFALMLAQSSISVAVECTIQAVLHSAYKRTKQGGMAMVEKKSCLNCLGPGSPSTMTLTSFRQLTRAPLRANLETTSLWPWSAAQ